MDINYAELDTLCIPMVKYFNSIGLITEYSCQGHNNKLQNKFEIIFNKEVTDDQIIEFLSKYSVKYEQSPFIGYFYKWIRMIEHNVILRNWIYVVDYGNYCCNQKYAKEDLLMMLKGDNYNEQNTNG